MASLKSKDSNKAINNGTNENSIKLTPSTTGHMMKMVIPPQLNNLFSPSNGDDNESLDDDNLEKKLSASKVFKVFHCKKILKLII